MIKLCINCGRPICSECGGCIEQNTPNCTGHNMSCSKMMTAREKQIAILLVQGYRKKIMAEKMHLAVGTINNYILNVYRKSGIAHNGKIKEHRIQLLELMLGKTIRELLDEKENTT